VQSSVQFRSRDCRPVITSPRPVHMLDVLRECARTLLTLNFCLAVVWSGLVIHFMGDIAPSQRPFPGQIIRVSGGTEAVFVRDGSFDHAHKSDAQQACPDKVLLLICTLVPLASLTLGMLARRNASDVSAFVHGWMLSWSCEALTLSLVKNYVGMFRPSFYEGCGFNASSWQCTKPDTADSRRAFPSAHAGSAFATLLFATLYLLKAVAALPHPCVLKITSLQARSPFPSAPNGTRTTTCLAANMPHSRSKFDLWMFRRCMWTSPTCWSRVRRCPCCAQCGYARAEWSITNTRPPT
jgi:hypothetical protein